MPDTHRKPLRDEVSRRPAASSGTGPYDSAFAELLTDSYQRLLGEPMLPAGYPVEADVARWLYDAAPFGLLAHDTSADPLFVYANTTAQRHFEYTWTSSSGCRPGCPPERTAGTRAAGSWTASCCGATPATTAANVPPGPDAASGSRTRRSGISSTGRAPSTARLL
ncbi:MEKHLA domain-containing protein [Parafrankia sp. BMG5.11]|nr:MEKHLA domain-containing protein [Parafrankia sp. BMG5.11]